MAKMFISFHAAITVLLLCAIATAAFRFPPGEERIALAPAPPPDGIRTQGGISAEDLVRNVFAEGGTCDNIFNIAPIGNQNGIGYFDQGASTIGLARGIILSTGPTGNAIGPNSATDRSGNFQDSNGDPDLQLMATYPVKDAVGIEFDFVPLDSIVTFRYVFASEEYCEFVGSIYNDVFGFFIKGPGIQGGFSGNAANVALIPGSNDFVAINTVNHQQNTAYYIRNERQEDANECGIPNIASPYSQLIEYDGFTTQLTAVLRLSPCQTYHIRLVVSDIADNYYDSAVFLEAGSFNLGGQVALGAGTSVSSGLTVNEGCSNGFFTFEREADAPDDFPLSVGIRVAASSQALEGIDFAPLPGVVTIPAGQSSVDMPVIVFNDALTEDPEKIVLELDIPCACYSDSAELIIIDPPPYVVNLPDVFTCANEPALLSPDISGGSPPYAYQWSFTTSTAPTVSTLPLAGTIYAVTVTDACGHAQADTCEVFLTQPPTALLSGSATICEGDTAWLPLVVTGAPPWVLNYTLNGVMQVPLTLSAGAPGFPAYQDGVHQLLSVSDQACQGQASGQGDINLMQIEVNAQISELDCFGDTDGAITVSVSGGTPPYQLQWDQGLGSAYQLQSLSAGLYTLSVTDDAGCLKVSTFEIADPAPLQSVEVSCEMLQSGVLQLSAAGGTPPYQYAVDNGAFSDATLFETLEAGTTYQLHISDAEGCITSHSFLMPVAYGEMATLHTPVEAKLGLDFTFEPVWNLPFSLIETIRWSPAGDLSCSDCPNPQLVALQEGSYLLQVTDRFGCRDSYELRLLIDRTISVYIPNAFSPNHDQVNDWLTVYANSFQVAEVLSFQIFDRWGGFLFESTHFAPNEERAGWDGNARGRPLDPGVYLYVTRLLLTDGSERTITGDVMLMR
jgi:gliding motility-associated-like protein